MANLNLVNYPLERFLIWLTGNDHSVSVVIDEIIAQAIKETDPTESLCHVEVMKSGCVVVWWKDAWVRTKYERLTLIELYAKLTTLMSEGNINEAQIVQQIIKDKQ